MRRSKRLLILSFVAFCAVVSLETNVALAASCSSGKVQPGWSCGCLGWIGLVWNPNQDCTGSLEDDILCASGACDILCGGKYSLDEMAICDSNQYGSWLGFRCSIDPCVG
jgi:hypothetical protein